MIASVAMGNGWQPAMHYASTNYHPLADGRKFGIEKHLEDFAASLEDNLQL